jgi:CheY-like chemotaxis protein
MSGLELLPKAKALRPDVPVIVITAYGDAETKRKASDGGAHGLFTKPIDFAALRGEIDTGSDALLDQGVPIRASAFGRTAEMRRKVAFGNIEPAVKRPLAARAQQKPVVYYAPLPVCRAPS